MAKRHDLYAHSGSVVECMCCDEVWYEADDLAEAVEIYLDRESGCNAAITPNGDMQTSCGGRLELSGGDYHHIKFCPFCGRRLTLRGSDLLRSEQAGAENQSAGVASRASS